ncbi:MAG: sodium-translocating pyrophosphatase [bacterium]|nr:sodium-translocating pyrophosphatase [bacterium]
MQGLIFLGIGGGVLALIYASILYLKIKKSPEGNDRMKEISGFIRTGAMSFLFREYIVLAPFVLVLFLLIGLFLDPQSISMGGSLGTWLTAISFLGGAFLSAFAGFVGMKSATSANARTCQAAKDKGLIGALKVAFNGGAVMGMLVVGLGLFGVTLFLIIARLIFQFEMIDAAKILTGFGLGASSIALFARVGGGIYTKAADVGADLMGKIEAGIPEDDPRNPAVIADNVGDNVGDVAGMGADLFESYVGSLIAAITLGLIAPSGDSMTNVLFPLLLSSVGIVAAIIGSFFVRTKGNNPQHALDFGTLVSNLLVVIGALALSYLMFGDLRAFFTVTLGLFVGIFIGKTTEYYTSGKHSYVQRISKQSLTGSATNIIEGLSVGMRSTGLPVLAICVGIIGAHAMLGIYGVALAAVGMLATIGITVAIDAYGPIADNAGGIAEMAHLDKHVREITDKLDSVGNTTAAIGKGFAIGSATLTSLALFASFLAAVNANGVEIESIDITNPKVISGLFIGAMLPFLFSAMTMTSVGNAAKKMIDEVRRQFTNEPGILAGTHLPDYGKCVDISTSAALKEMILPGIMAVLAPLIVGIVLGAEALGGLLAGSLSSGLMMAIFMANAGGAWDNAKKYIEEGYYGGKGSESHKAAVTGDTVGDPFKDTSGPSINILIKLMTIVSLVFASLFGTGLF